MEFNTHERGKRFAAVSIAEPLLHNYDRIAVALSTANLLRNAIIDTQALEDALRKVAAQTPRAETENRFDSLTDRPASGERLK